MGLANGKLNPCGEEWEPLARPFGRMGIHLGFKNMFTNICNSNPSLRSFGAAVLSIAVLTFLLATAAPAEIVRAEDDLSKLGGEWVYVEDRTEGRALEQMGPPMSGKFALKAEKDAIILVYGHGSGQRDVVVKLDGTLTEKEDKSTGRMIRYKATWKNGALTTDTDFVRKPGQAAEGLIRREFRPTADGLLVKVTITNNAAGSIGLYRHPEDIPMPTPAKATINDLAWLSGSWMGTRSSGSTIEELWSAPKGGAMLATSRTVNTKSRMSAFEYLRIVERDGGLVYVAQPGGAPATEFILTEFSPTRAVFENPRHDYPKRIMYELSADGSLTASIGSLKGGTPRKFEFKREGK